MGDRHGDLAVRRLFRHGACNERAVGHALPRLFPDGGRCSLCLGGVLRADELVRTLARWYLQRLLVCQAWLPRTYLGSVPLPLLRRHLLLGFGSVENTRPWYVALIVLLGFST